MEGLPVYLFTFVPSRHRRCLSAGTASHLRVTVLAARQNRIAELERGTLIAEPMRNVTVDTRDGWRRDLRIKVNIVKVILETGLANVGFVTLDTRFVLHIEDNMRRLLSSVRVMLECIPRRQCQDRSSPLHTFADMTVDAANLLSVMVKRRERHRGLRSVCLKKSIVEHRFRFGVTRRAKAVVLFQTRNIADRSNQRDQTNRCDYDKPRQSEAHLRFKVKDDGLHIGCAVGKSPTEQIKALPPHLHRTRLVCCACKDLMATGR